MQLSELFVSHKQVEPVSFDRPTPSTIKPIYLNLDRAHKVTSEPEGEDTPVTETVDMSAWKVPELEGVTTKWSNPYSHSKNSWVSDLTAAYKKFGLNDNAIKNLLSKNALESSWGRSAQGDFNFGNITTGKSWTGRFVQGRDKDASGNPISQKFRAYSSMDDYVKDEIQLLTNLYDFNQDDSFDTFIGKLQGGNSGKRKYAEDLQYADKVRKVYNSI